MSTSQGSAKEPPEIVKKLEARREAYKDHGLIYRVAWITAGVIVVLAGIAMIVFPGPAIVVIPLGLAMLSFEFAWAQSLLDKALEGGSTATDAFKQASRRQQVLLVAAIVLGIAAFAVAGYALFLR